MGKIILGIISAGFMILGFSVWRFNLNFPTIPLPVLSDFSPHWSYFLIGAVVGAALIWGKIMGGGLAAISLLPLGYGVFQLLFDKGVSWSQVQEPILWGIGLFVLACILFAMGSETVYQGHLAQQEHDRRGIECAMCGQALGTAQSFQSPCPRCGSNRYDYI